MPEDLEEKKFLLILISVDPLRSTDRLVHWLVYNIPGGETDQGQTVINYNGTVYNTIKNKTIQKRLQDSMIFPKPQIFRCQFPILIPNTLKISNLHSKTCSSASVDTSEHPKDTKLM